MGAITIEGKLHLKLFTQIMDADYYVSIIKEYYKSMKSFGIEGWILQFDNDPKHKNTKAKNCLKKKNIKPIDWPSYSPDSIIKFFRLVTSKLNKKDIYKKSELMNKVENLLNKHDLTFIHNWIKSISGRFRECIMSLRERINY